MGEDARRADEVTNVSSNHNICNLTCPSDILSDFGEGRGEVAHNCNMHITRRLRKNQTPWESKLWNVLKNRQIKNWKFRRQFKIGDYVVDFCCLEKKLIIELDGGQHNYEDNIQLDTVRQKFLEQQGFEILRFWNNEVDSNLEGVIDRIMQRS